MKTQWIQRFCYYSLALLSLASACNESDPTDEPEPTDSTSGEGLPTGIYHEVNLIADTSASSIASAEPLFYSLENHKVVAAEYAQTTEWDICFEGIYSSSITVNNGTSVVSHGYGGPGVGGLYLHRLDEIEAQYYEEGGLPPARIPSQSLFDQAFDLTTTVPIEDAEFHSRSINMDYFNNSAYGWAYYDFYGDLYPSDTSDIHKHVCYALPRPIIVRTAKGNYAKLIIYSMYESAPEEPDRSYQPGFLTFKYAIQKDGSFDLAIEDDF